MPHLTDKRLGYLLKRAQHALRLRMDEALLPLALTTPQYSALCAVERMPGISNAALARAAFVTAQTMQGIEARMLAGFSKKEAMAFAALLESCSENLSQPCYFEAGQAARRTDRGG